jgi:hypothetical protein
MFMTDRDANCGSVRSSDVADWPADTLRQTHGARQTNGDTAPLALLSIGMRNWRLRSPLSLPELLRARRTG